MSLGASHPAHDCGGAYYVPKSELITDALDSEGRVIDVEVSPEDQRYAHEQMRKFEEGISDWLDSVALAKPYTPRKPPDGLLSLIGKVAETEGGSFADVVEDLNGFGESECNIEAAHVVASAYAYRLAMAALFFQGAAKREDYDQARQIHEESADYVAATEEEALAGKHQGYYFVFIYSRRHDMEDAVLSEFDQHAQKGFDFYILAKKHDIDVDYVEIDDDEIAVMSVEDCIRLIQFDIR